MKVAEIRDLSADELQRKIAEETAKVEDLKLNHAISPLENPLVIRNSKKLIAQLKTVLNEKK
jgi:large subunit ribosomal protein L29